MSEDEREDHYIPPGTIVRYDGFGEDQRRPEYGVVVHCWEDHEMGYDCYVAFFGAKLPAGKPTEKPYVLRYSATSLVQLGR